MNLVPPDFRARHASALDDTVSAGAGAMLPEGRDQLEAKWAALHEAAAVVCALAGEEPGNEAPEVRDFPLLIENAGSGRRVLAENGIDDLIAVMEPGIVALLTVNARGIEATHAASALWREFVAARDALLALLPPA